MINQKTLRLNPEQDNEGYRKLLAERIDKTRRKDYVAHANYHYPRTKEEYWKVVDEWWTELLGIFYRFLPMESCTWKDDTLLSEPLAIHLQRLKENHDSKLVEAFNACWGTAPDNASIHTIPGWETLCDLCSECSVLYEEE